VSKLPSRCFYASTLVHGALLGTLWVVSSGFLKGNHKPTDMGPVMTWVNPDRLVDMPGMVGGGEPQPAPPEVKTEEPIAAPPQLDPLPAQPKVVEPPPQTPPKGTVDEPPPKPEPVVKPAPEKPPEAKPKPKAPPKPKAVKPPKTTDKSVEKIDKPEPETAKQEEPAPSTKPDKTAKPADKGTDRTADTAVKPPTKRVIKPNLKPVTGKPDGAAEAAAEAKRRQEAQERADRAYQQAQEQRQALIDSRRHLVGSTVAGIQGQLSSSTVVTMPGTGGEAYMDYGLFVRTRFDQAWRTPQDVTDQNATVKAEVIIARDGTIVSTRILQKSGIAALDKSVSEALARVDKIGKPFPEGAKDEKRQFIINFNLKSRRANG
jgi:hypothetical protein